MILKASQRGHGRRLAQHLLNMSDNDHVEVHVVHGFLSDDVSEAFAEIEATAKGTKCRQPFFSVSLSPPQNETCDLSAFEDAAKRVAKANGLDAQPYVLIFHEKDGRRHAHAVFSRIDATTMTAINLPHFKNRLQSLSRQLYFEHQWQMPDGLRDRSLKSPTNVTLAEWQAAKRRGKNAIDQKALIQQCWAASDSRAGFEAALSDHGYCLAIGDRRGHVIACHDGEVFTVARATGLKAKDIKKRLGAPENLPTVDEALASHAKDVRSQFGRMAREARNQLFHASKTVEARRLEMIAAHRAERQKLLDRQAERWKTECAVRRARLRSGLAGLWQGLTGKRKAITGQNEREALSAVERDRAQRRRLTEAQLHERQGIEQERKALRQEVCGLIRDMRADRDALITKLTQPNTKPLRRRQRPNLDQEIGFEPGLEP